jgi:Mg-chelatase subunit ChlD
MRASVLTVAALVAASLLAGVDAQCTRRLQFAQTNATCSRFADVVFVLDESGSVGLTNYQSAKAVRGGSGVLWARPVVR